MESFSYTARNSIGQLINGSLESQGRKAAISTLKKRGYYLLSIDVQSRLGTAYRTGLGHGHFSTSQRAIFTRQLATLLGAGMHLSIALKTLISQTANKKLCSIIEQLHSDIEGSSSLSTAMAKHPRAFPPTYTAIVGAAEETGMLAQTLSSLSIQLKTQASINLRIRTAMTYPIFLLLVGGAVVAILVSYVVPKFVVLFVNAEQQLPLPTLILVGSIELIKQFWWLMMMLPIALIGLFCALWRQESTRLAIDHFLLGVPMLGKLNNKIQLARFARTLGALLNGGVRIIEALAIVAKVTGNRAFSKEVADTAQRIAKGSSLAKALREQKHFSEVIVNMAAVGEETGALSDMLLEVADIYDQESQSAIETMTNLLGPIMIIILGLLVGFVVLAILLPIFETSTIIN